MFFARYEMHIQDFGDFIHALNNFPILIFGNFCKQLYIKSPKNETENKRKQRITKQNKHWAHCAPNIFRISGYQIWKIIFSRMPHKFPYIF